MGNAQLAKTLARFSKNQTLSQLPGMSLIAIHKPLSSTTEIFVFFLFPFLFHCALFACFMNRKYRLSFYGKSLELLCHPE